MPRAEQLLALLAYIGQRTRGGHRPRALQLFYVKALHVVSSTAGRAARILWITSHGLQQETTKSRYGSLHGKRSEKGLLLTDHAAFRSSR